MAKKLEIKCAPEVMDNIEKHCFSELHVEVGGFLLGNHADGVTEIKAAVKAEKTKQSQAQLTFTHETWDELHKLIDEKHADLELLGWYHSHPGFGVFLSDYDAFIQHSFFSGPQYVALVVDPLKGVRGWFVSKNEKVESIKEEKTDRDKVSTKPKAAVLAESKNKKEKATVNFGLTAMVSTLLIILAGAVAFITFDSISKKNREISDLQNQLLFVSQSTPSLEKFAPVDGSEKSSSLIKFPFQVTVEKNLAEVALKVYGTESGLEQILLENPNFTKDTVLQEGEVVLVPVKATFSMPEKPAVEATPTPSPTPSASAPAAPTPTTSSIGPTISSPSPTPSKS